MIQDYTLSKELTELEKAEIEKVRSETKQINIDCEAKQQQLNYGKYYLLIKISGSIAVVYKIVASPLVERWLS